LKVGRSGEIATLIRQKLIINLELTPEQRDKFEPLIKKTADEMEASHLDCLKRISDAVDKMHAQILPDLTPEQREKLKQVEADRHVMMRQKYNYPPDTAKAP
jgi:Spy/CpxP family protein refolding chaperone